MRRSDSSWGADLAANGNRIPSIWSRPRLLIMMSASRRLCRVAEAVGDEDDGATAARADFADCALTASVTENSLLTVAALMAGTGRYWPGAGNGAGL